MKQTSSSQSKSRGPSQSQSQPRGAMPKPVRVEQVTDRVETGITQLDAERAQGYAQLATLRTAKSHALERRAQLYTLKYGAKDPRVAQARRQRENNVQLQREIDQAHTQAATPAPEIDEKGYVLHGFVRNRAREPQPKLTVALYDEKGALVRETGYACTDENGYFLLRYQRPARGEKPAAVEQTAKITEREKAAAQAPAKTEKTELKTQKQLVQEAGAKDAPRTEPSRTEQARAYEIRVHRDQQLIHRETKPVQPRIGQLDYREIILGDESCGCTPPPEKSAAASPTKPKAPSTGITKHAAKPKRKSAG